MQKEIIIVSIILAIMIIFLTLLQGYTNRAIETMNNKLERLYGIAKDNSDDREKVNEMSDEIDSEWKDINGKMSFFLEHTELEKISTSIVAMEEYFELGNNEDALVEIAKCKYILKHLQEKSTFSFSNLF